MNILQSIVMLIPWLLWLFYWLARATDTKKTVKRETSLSRSLQNSIVTFGALLILLPSFSMSALSIDVTSIGPLTQLGTIINVAGLLFTVWARIHLGRNWSAAVTLKQDHELVRSGPYAWVRHPIYTGCLLALCGCVLINAEIRGVIGFIIVFVATAYKARMEESVLANYFGADYVNYRERVRALVPGIY
jgi:protein-S-isoprenylcysteine O-methyltransferase Ste14